MIDLRDIETKTESAMPSADGRVGTTYHDVQESDVAVEVRDLSLWYGHQRALTDVSLSFPQKKVTALINRLNASEARLRQIRNDSASHAASDATTLAQLREHETALGELRTTVEAQRAEITMLEQRVDSVVRANIVLASQKDSLVIVATTMEAREDSVLMFGRGKTMVPARTLDPSQFTVLSKSRDRQIMLPRADKEYRIVSRQALEYTDLARPRDAIVKGTLTITDSEKFWAPSKFLILVEK